MQSSNWIELDGDVSFHKGMQVDGHSANHRKSTEEPPCLEAHTSGSDKLALEFFSSP